MEDIYYLLEYSVVKGLSREEYLNGFRVDDEDNEKNWGEAKTL